MLYRSMSTILSCKELCYTAETSSTVMCILARHVAVQGKPMAKQEDMSVPVDDAQPTCALSGERFETFWDDASEEWRYRDAVRLDAEQAAG